MSSYFRLLDAGRQFFDDNGAVLNGGKLYTYEAGTTTNKAAYQDDAGVAAHTNPIILDSAGRIPSSAEVWGTTGAYKLKLDDSADANIWTRDDIVGFNDTATVSASEWIASNLTPTYVGSTSFTFAGDQTTVFHAGRRLKITDSGGTVYASIQSAAYSDPNTTVTIRGDTIDSGISDVSYGIISAANRSVEDYSGIVGFHATPASDQTSVATSTWTNILFATETHDYGDDFASSIFTAPADGVYHFAWTVTTTTNLGDGDVFATRLQVNAAGNGVAGTRDTLGSATTGQLSCSAVVPLSAGDTVRPQVFHNLGSAVVLDADGNTSGIAMYFSGVRLS